MTWLRFQPQPGVPVYEQLLYAARRAIIAGRLEPGETFPSVREISRILRINPNTAQRALTELKNEGLIETLPGIGNRVCALPASTARERSAWMKAELEAVVLRARQLGLSLDQLTGEIENQWNKL